MLSFADCQLFNHLRLAFVLHSAKARAERQIMFKIQKSTDGEVVVFTLSGRITAAHLAELQKLLESEADDQKIVLDLQEVKLVDRDILRRPQRPGDGLYLRCRIGRAETEVAAADGSLRKDRLFRPDRAAGGFWSVGRPDDDSETRGEHLGLERPEEVDR